jgi:RNA polymerase sigma factor (sigma-70 family)
MNVHISYKAGKTPDVERDFNHHIQKLQRRLQLFRPELVHLHAIVDQNFARALTTISLNLRLPSGQLAAQDSGSAPTVALKGVFSELTKQLTKHKELLRGHRRARKSKGNGKSQVPFEQTMAAVHAPMVTDTDINSYINANLGRLNTFIERELRYRINSGRLEAGSVTAEEVLDEVVVTALGDGEEKPELLSLERWLYRIALKAITQVDQLSHEPVSTVPLEQSTRQRNVRASDEPILQYHQPDEAMLREEIIADRRIATPEEITYSDEMISLVESALLGARREDREAFILYAVEGFTLDEIAATTDRKDEQVRQSIHAAREHLKKTLRVPDQFKSKILQPSRIA